MRFWTMLPDEIAGGYIGRLRRESLLSGKGGLPSLMRAVETPSGESCSNNSSAPLLALLRRLDMDTKTLVCRHSLVPVNKCVSTFNRNAVSTFDFGDHWFLSFAMHVGFSPRLCRDCVSEDISYWGMTYWRRSHQLQGITWCSKHRRPLSYTKHYLGVEQSPRAALANAVDIPHLQVEVALKSAVVQRYSSVLESMLDNAQGPVHSACAANIVRTQANASGLRIAPLRHARYLSDAAKELLPKIWLAEHFPASQCKRPGEFAPWIDQAGHARTKPVGSTTFALALALLWDQPDEAIRLFLGANKMSEPDIRPKGYRPNLDRRSMHSLWLDHKGSHVRIAEATGHSYRQVQRLFSDAGMFSAAGSQFERAVAAKSRFLRGESLAAASRSEKVRVKLVEALIRVTSYEGAHEEYPSIAMRER